MTTIQWPLDSAFSFLQQHPIEQLLFVEIMTSLPCHKLNWWIFHFFDNSSLLFAHSPLNFSIFQSLIQFPSTASIFNSMDDSWVSVSYLPYLYIFPATFRRPPQNCTSTPNLSCTFSNFILIPALYMNRCHHHSLTHLGFEYQGYHLYFLSRLSHI